MPHIETSLVVPDGDKVRLVWTGSSRALSFPSMIKETSPNALDTPLPFFDTSSLHHTIGLTTDTDRPTLFPTTGAQLSSVNRGSSSSTINNLQQNKETGSQSVPSATGSASLSLDGVRNNGSSSNSSSDSSIDYNKSNSNKNLILGSILGGVLGLAACALIMFCALNLAGWIRTRKFNRQNSNAVKSHRKSPRPYSPDPFDEPTWDSMPWPKSTKMDLDKTVPSLSTPTHFDPSPFSSDDLLNIGHLVQPKLPKMSTRRKSHMRSKSRESRNARSIYQYRPRPDILAARRAPRPPMPRGIQGSPQHQSVNTSSLSATGPQSSIYVSARSQPFINEGVTSAEDIRTKRYSHRSSIYTPLALFDHLSLDPGRVSRSSFLRTFPLGSSGESNDVTSSSVKAEVKSPKLNISHAAPFPRRVLSTHQEELEKIHDDGQGDYPEFQFDDTMLGSPASKVHRLVPPPPPVGKNPPKKAQPHLKQNASKSSSEVQKPLEQKTISDQDQDPYADYMSFVMAYEETP